MDRKGDGYPMRKIKVKVSVSLAVAVLDDGDGAVTQRAETIAIQALNAAVAARTNSEREDEGITSYAHFSAAVEERA